MVQCWAAHALSLIADTGGPLFRGFVDDSLSCVMRLLLTTAPTAPGHNDVLLSVARLLSAIITTLGPELATNDPSTQRYIACHTQ